jgi:hypothetical protein
MLFPNAQIRSTQLGSFQARSAWLPLRLYLLLDTRNLEMCMRGEAKRHREDAPQYVRPGDPSSASLSCSDGRAWARVHNHVIAFLA